MSADRRAALVALALPWLGTPYHHHGRVQGVGVDCAMLLAEVYTAAGLIAPIDAGHYPHDWHLNRSEELFLAWLAKLGARQVDAPQLGDVGVWRFGRTYSHGGIVVEAGAVPLVLHAYINQAVIRTAADEEPLASRPCRWFTLFND